MTLQERSVAHSGTKTRFCSERERESESERARERERDRRIVRGSVQRNTGKQEDMSAVRTLQLLLVGLVLLVQFVVGTGAETGANNQGKKRHKQHVRGETHCTNTSFSCYQMRSRFHVQRKRAVFRN